jgi:plastocyanin
MRSRYLGCLIAVLGGGLVAVPAIAVSETSPSPTVEGLESIMWSPMEVTVAPGGTVTFQNMSASVPHGVVWEAGNPEVPVCSGVPIDEGKIAWKGTCTFVRAGTYKFYCYVHGMAMSGTIDVSSSGPPPTSTPMTMPGGGATTTSPTVSIGQPGSTQVPASPLRGSPAHAIRLARNQHGSSVRGSVHISQTGAGARLEVDLLAGHSSLLGASRHAHAPGGTGHPSPVRVGRLLRSSLRAGSFSFSVPLSAIGRAALGRDRHLGLMVKLTLTPMQAAPVVIMREVVLHA